MDSDLVDRPGRDDLFPDEAVPGVEIQDNEMLGRLMGERQRKIFDERRGGPQHRPRLDARAQAVEHRGPDRFDMVCYD